MQLRHRTSSSRGCRSVVDASILLKQGNTRNLSFCTCSRCTEKTCYFVLSGVLGRLANVFLFRCKHAKYLYTFSKNCAWTAGHCAWHVNALALKLPSMNVIKFITYFCILTFACIWIVEKKCKRELQPYEYWIIISHYYKAQMVASVATGTVGKTVCLWCLHETEIRFLPLFMTASSALLKKREKHQLSPCSSLHNDNGSLTVRPTRGS